MWRPPSLYIGERWRRALKKPSISQRERRHDCNEQAMMRVRRGPALVIASLALCGEPISALALRPYDSTDAAVADRGELELELGPVGRLKEGDRHFRVAPAVVVNYGFAEGKELVIEARREVALDAGEGQAHSSIVDDGVFIKQVLRPGVMQGQPGLSVATEYGVLLPSIHGESGTGVSLAGIVSHRNEAITLHLNGAAAINREHEPEVFLGAILEGPSTWVVRPVGEVFADQARGSARTVSRLVGAIWNAKEGLSLDVGVRSAHAGSEGIRELRVGFTWAIALEKGT
jgi:hypothetical protein